MKKNTASLADQAYELLEEMIVTLKLEPGQVYSESEIREQIDIGRTPMREALLRLAAENLVIMLPRKGMMISTIDIADQLTLLETRRVLDRLIAGRAARRATADQSLEDHGKAMMDAAATGNLNEFMKLDRELDLLIANIAGNNSAARATAPLHVCCRRFWYRYKTSGDLNQSAALHQALIQAIVQGNVEEAERASDALIDYLASFTRSALDH